MEKVWTASASISILFQLGQGSEKESDCMIVPSFELSTDRLYIRPVKETDKDVFMKLRTSTSELADAYAVFPDYIDVDWDYILHPDYGSHIYHSVFLRDTSVFIGDVSVQDYDTPELKIGFDVVEAYRNQGYATEMGRAVIRKIWGDDQTVRVFLKARETNVPSRRVIEKLGGVLVGTEALKLPIWKRMKM